MLFFLGFTLLWLPIRIFYPTKVIGKKNIQKKKGAVLTCNHYSNMDAIILDIFLNKKLRFLAKKELFKNKFVSYFLKRVGGFPIDREKPEMSSIKFALNTLKNEKLLGIFPEGSRNKDGDETQMQELKNGAIMFASKSGKTLIPMILYRRPKVFRRNYLIIGEPMQIEGENTRKLTPEEVDSNAERLAEAMDNLRKEMDAKLAAKKAKTKNS